MADIMTKADFDKLGKVAAIITDLLIDDVKDEWILQGHDLTGDYIASLKAVIEVRQAEVISIVYGNIYGNYLDSGVSASRVPFTGTSGRGRGKGNTSAYIQGLVRYVKMRIDTSAGEKKALGIAFAIAHTQRKEGMPTRASYRHSATGDRTDFIKRVLDRSAQAAQELASEEMGRVIDVAFERFINNINTQKL